MPRFDYEKFHPGMTWAEAPDRAEAADVVAFPAMAHARGSISYLEKMFIAELMVMSRPRVIVETGAFRGMTTRFIADVLRRNAISPCVVYSFDWPEVIEELKRRDPDLAEDPHVSFVPGRLPEALASFLARQRDPVDFAIVDAHHDYRSVRADLRQLGPRLRPGGYIFCHDYREADEVYFGTCQAIDEFAAAQGFDLLALNPGGHVWGAAILRKKPERPPAFRAWRRQLPFHRLRWWGQSLRSMIEDRRRHRAGRRTV